MPAPSASLVMATDPCRDDQFWCSQVWEWSGSPAAARVADFVIGRPLAVLLIVLIGLVARWLIHRGIDKLVRRAESGVLPTRVGRLSLPNATSPAEGRRAQRSRTIGSLLKSVATGVVVAIVVVMSLSELGLNVAPLLTGAGILGLALGFGAQSLVKDFLSGIFLIFEDQFGVGDVIEVGEVNGTVEAVSLRVTRVRDVSGTVWYLRNGEILKVGNQSQNWARAVLDVSVPWTEDVAKVRRVLAEVAHDMWQDDEFREVMIEEPEVWGVQSIDSGLVTVRLTVKTAPLVQWSVARTLRERIKSRFDHEGIVIGS